jgi:hypothetical protein
MTNSMIRIHNMETDEVIDREATAEELAEWEAEKAAQAQQAAEEAARLSAKLAIYAKLGLTEEEINTLIS